ncbi:MAG: response regulator [Peptococcaceae bacterium]
MLENSKILICDDSLLVRKKLRATLRKTVSGQIIEASNGAEAVVMYKATKPSLVFMDIVMPNLNGIEAVKLIKEFDDQAQIIMLSSSGTKNHLKQAIEAGAVNFLQKPLNEERLQTLLKKYGGESGGNHV